MTRNALSTTGSALRCAGFGTAVMLALSFATAGTALAHWAGPTPPAVPPTVGREVPFTGENPNCGRPLPAGHYEFKIEDPGTSHYTDPGDGPLEVDVTVRNTVDYGWLLDWIKNSGTQINTVIMKGGEGSGGNYYFYENQPPNVAQDANLHAALKNNKAQGISHVTFCYSLTEEKEYEGCTLGYWKNHLDSWPQTGYATTQNVTAVFSNALGFVNAGDTLLDALLYKGGPKLADKVKLLLKQGVAALLSAAHPDVDYPLTPADVISQVNAAISTGDQLQILGLQAMLNGLNNAGCPLN